MYKAGSDRHQTALFRGKLSDWSGGAEVLSAEDQLSQLQVSTKLLEARIMVSPKGSPERKALGVQKFEVQEQIKVLRGTLPKSPPDWKLHFVDEAKRLLSASQFEMIFNAAKIGAEREQRNREKAESIPGVAA
jgi:hypothetical protein